LPFKGSTLRVWLPSRRLELPSSWKPFSASHTHGFCPSELFSNLMAPLQFPAVDPLLRFVVKPKGLTSTLQRFPLTRLAVHPATDHVLEFGWSHCSPELLRLSGLMSLDMGRSAFLLPAPLTLSSPTSEDVGGGAPGVFLQQCRISLLSKGANPSGVLDRQPLLILWSVNLLRPIFSARRAPKPCDS
jgi:hypothetical protein